MNALVRRGLVLAESRRKKDKKKCDVQETGPSQIYKSMTDNNQRFARILLKRSRQDNHR